MQILFNNQNNKEYQAMLNSLLKDVFFDFQFWYDLDLWDENYESYSMFENGEIVSNICVFKTQILCDGTQYPALSVGAVATKEEYRGRGLARSLMEHIIEKYEGTPMYLFANEDVVNFYPKFGFKRVSEKLPVCHCEINNDNKPKKIQYNDPKVWDYVCKRVNYSQKLDCLNSASINIFHIYSGYLKDLIYEIPELDTLVIAEQKNASLKLIGVFSLREIDFSDLAKYLPFRNVEKVEFGFMPYWSELEYEMQIYETDPIFIRGITCELGDVKFPELSIT